MKMYTIPLILGDYSGDGHGVTETYKLGSSLPLKDLRELYFKAVELHGFDLGREVCSKYDDCVISEEICEKLTKNGYPDMERILEGERWIDTDAYVHIFIWYMTSADPSLRLELISSEEMFHFYGADKRGRHIPPFGYGLLG